MVAVADTSPGLASVVAVGDRLVFERHDARVDARRHYAMTVTRDAQLPLFESDDPVPLILVIAHGRIGQKKRVRRLRFDDVAELARRWRALVALRRRHGYVEVAR